MEEFNRTLFLAINASEHPNALILAVAKLLANDVVWLIPAVLLLGWLRGRERTRLVLLEAAASGVVGLMINQAIGLVWSHPRPFMIGVGHSYIAHVADSSFPSDHLTLIWAVAFSLLTQERTRLVGITLAALGLPVAWARIYLGIHFPLDMFGAAVVAVLSAWMCFRGKHLLVVPLYGLAVYVHRRVFSSLIQRGWVQK